MARLVERILVWVAILVTLAAVVAVAVTVLPTLKLPSSFDKPMAWLRSHQPGSADRPAIERAEDLVAAGDSAGALKAAQQAISDNPNDAAIANRAGNVALRAGDERAAERYYLAGESADRTDAWNFVALGQLYARRGDRDHADAQLRAAAAAAPTLAFVHYDLGLVELDEHLFAAALSDFEAELRISPNFKPALIGRAEALEKIGRRGEALALYRRAGVVSAGAKQTVKRPKLKAQPLVQPSPSPTAVAVANSPSPSPSPTPEPSASPSPSSRPRPSPTNRGSIRLAAATARPAPTSRRPPESSSSSPSASPTPTSAPPTATPKPLEAVIADAKSYVLGVGQDLNFTRALPRADPNQSTTNLRDKLSTQLSRHNTDIEGALSTGSSALLSGRLEIATSAFRQVSDDAPRDWRGPYLAGLTAQAQGDTSHARAWFTEALAREARPEPYTSLAILDLNDGDLETANADARKAAAIDPTYGPGRFVAGMVDLVQNNVRDAQRNLEAALALGGAPSRTEYFVSALQQSVGEAALPGLR